MSTNFMPEEIVFNLHFNFNHSPTPGLRYVSGFIAALRDARRVTGRDILNGSLLKITGSAEAGSWIGAIGYMALLDQIGTCFKPRSASVISEPRSICRALKYFARLSLQDPEIEALYALRCAFTHDYSLYNINKNNPSLTHRFSVNAALTGAVVILPAEQWDGIYENRNSKNETRVNLKLFGDLVESICTQLFTLQHNNDLEILLQGGSDELVDRYAFVISEPSKLV